jgi:hypothetical protein
MSTSNIIRVVQTTLIAIGLAFGISVVVAGHWWSDKPHLDLDALGQHVTSSMQTQFDTTADTKSLGLHVGKDIMLINVNGNDTGAWSLSLCFTQTVSIRLRMQQKRPAPPTCRWLSRSTPTTPGA